MSNKDAYETKLKAQIDEWSAEIDKLKIRADGAEADAQMSYYKRVDELRAADSGKRAPRRTQ